VSQLKVVSFNLDNNPEGEKLVKSAQFYGYNLSFIGQGQGFKNFRQLKIDLLLSELENVKERFVMFTDGLDSWFLSKDILKLYKDFNSLVVVSGNRDWYPAQESDYIYPESPTSFRYICSSQFIGETKAVIHTLETIRDNYAGFTDQEGWNVCYSKGLIPAVIDHSCKLFLNMTGVFPEELDDRFVLKETGIRPASIHFGGPKGDDPNNTNMKNLFEKWRANES